MTDLCRMLGDRTPHEADPIGAPAEDRICVPLQQFARR